MSEQVDDPRPWLRDPPSVTAIIVAHNGMRWLPQALASLSQMEVAPNAWHAVDVASTDGSGDLLRDVFGAERLTYAASGTGFGQAVTLGLEMSVPTDWIWLLHDDMSIQPGTLACLLDEALAPGAETVAVVGPKIREWPSLKRLVEVGVAYGGTGNRETGLEPGEPDDGQHDRPRDVLAVSSAGILIRRDVWDELGGFDRLLPMFGDDIDFGWRASRAGYRVRTAPSAVIFHAEGSSRRIRTRSAGDAPHWEKRRAAVFTLLAHASPRGFWWQYVRLFLGSMIRFFGFLLAQSPADAGDELQAIRSVYLHPGRLRAARRARREIARDESTSSVRKLLPGRWLPYQHGLDAARGAMTAAIRPEQAEITGRRSIGFDDSGDDEVVQVPSLWQRRPWLVVISGLALVSLLAGRHLLGAGPLHGGALLASPDAAGGWWQLYYERWHDVGIGSAAAAPPFALILGVAATPLWFAPDLLLTALFVASVPMAGLTAHRLGRRLTDRRGLRILWAVNYALLPIFTGAVAQGRLGTVVALVLLPAVVGSVLAMLEHPEWQAGVRLGLWIAVATAFAPILYVAMAIVLAALVLRRGRALGLPIAVSVLLPWLLLGQWMLQRAVSPARWWWEAGYADAGVGALAPTAWQLVLGHPGGTGSPPAILSIGIVVAGLIALARAASRPSIVTCWALGLLGLGAATLARLVTVAPGSGEVDVSVWVGIPLAVWLAALSTAALLAADDVLATGARPLRSLQRAALVVALVAPIGITGWWVVLGGDGPLGRGPTTDVPAYLASRDSGTLVLEGSVQSGLETSVVSSDGLRLGDEAVTPSEGDARAFDEVVTRIVSNPSTEVVDDLASFGVGAVYAPADVDTALARRMDAVPGLSPSGSPDPGARVWLVDAQATPPTPDGTAWRWLVAAAHTIAALVAIALAAPVRKRVRR